MKSLPIDDQLHLQAAEGWLGLGDLDSASDELENINPEYKIHPDVLEMRCEIYLKAKMWEYVLTIGRRLCEWFPKNANNWYYVEKSLYELGRVEESIEVLKKSMEYFPADPGNHYQVALRLVELNRLDEARAWLEKTFEVDLMDTFRQTALDDPRMSKIWSG